MTRNEHIDLERLSDFVDDRLLGDDRDAVQDHLASCMSCASQLARLQSLLEAAHALPDEIEPPPAVWADVRERLPRRAPSRQFPQRWLLAAAAVVLVVLSSTVTALLVRRQPVIVATKAAPPVTVASMQLPPPARSIDAGYAVAIRQLDEALAQRRAELDPATIAKVEASLNVIDVAIAEARRALADDPANRTLLDILAANYEHKVELLRRANELLPRT